MCGLRGLRGQCIDSLRTTCALAAARALHNALHGLLLCTRSARASLLVAWSLVGRHLKAWRMVWTYWRSKTWKGV